MKLKTQSIMIFFVVVVVIDLLLMNKELNQKRNVYYVYYIYLKYYLHPKSEICRL